MDQVSQESGPIAPFRHPPSAATRQPISAHLEFLELTDFKSYSGHHVLGPLKKGLNCIVGSNGSGKSNLMDAICFVLGVETKFLRGLRLHDLGYRREGGGAVRSAEVFMRLRIPSELDAKSATRLATFGRRAVDGKTSQFLIEGRPVDRSSYLKALAQYNILPRVQNCIVSQGQVEAWSLNTDKEKAQMFDEVSGSAQHKEKYDNLQKEISSVKMTLSRVVQEATTLQKEFKALKAQWEELRAWQVLEEEVKNANIELHLFKLYVNETAGNLLRGTRERIEADIARLEERTKLLDQKQREKERERRELVNELERLETLKEKAQKEDKDQATIVDDLVNRICAAQETLDKEVKNLEDKKAEMDELDAAYKDVGSRWSNLIDERADVAKKHAEDLRDNKFNKRPEKQRQHYLKEKEKASLKTAELEGQLQQVGVHIEQEEREQRSAEAQLTQVQADADKAKGNYVDCQNAVKDLKRSLTETEEGRIKLQTAYEQLGPERDELKKQKEEMVTELEKNQQIVISFSQYRSEDSKAARFRQTLDRLKNEIPGVFDRVTSLCELTSSRYATAVSTALGLQADSVVVDTFSSAKQAIELCKKMQVPPVEFLPLDTLKSRAMDTNLRNHSELFTPILDVIQFDSKFQTIFDHIFEDTVLVDDLDKARTVAFEGKHNLHLKIVTLDGQTILKNLNMKLQNPKSGQMDRFAQKQRDTAMNLCTALKAKLTPVETELRRIDKLYLQTETDFGGAKIEYDQIAAALRSKSNQLNILKTYYEEKNEELKTLKAFIKDKTGTIKLLIDKSEDLKKEIHKIHEKFLKTEDLLAMQREETALLAIKAEYDKMLFKFKDRENNFQLELNNILRRLGGAPDDYGVDHVMTLIESALQNPDVVLQDIRRTILSLREELARLEKEEATQNAIWTLKKQELEQVQKNYNIKNDRVNDLQVAVHDVNVERKRTFHRLSNLATEYKAAEQELEVLDTAGLALIKEVVLKDIRVPVKNGTLEELLDMAENPDLIMGDTDTFAEVDFSSIPDECRSLSSNEEIVEVQGHLEKRYKALKDDLVAKGNQNHKAEEAFEAVKNKLKEINDTRSRFNKQIRDKEKDLQKVADVRKEKFKTCFEHAKKALTQIYATLTEPPKTDFSAEGAAASIYAKHFSESVGGSANLELEDDTSDEPYNHGVIFTAMPYGKRYTEMELLSGGEKSMATLALLFSLQSYRQSPFVVLDEVDAALDAANVDALRRFLQRAKFQVVIVTLKEEMYCHADAIIGVYKDQVAESSETVTLDVASYPLASQPMKPNASPPQMTVVT